MGNLYGNAIVGQSGGPTAAINATLAGVIDAALDAAARGEIGRLYGMKNGVEGLLAENLIDLSARFADRRDELQTLCNTPASALGSCRKKLPDSASGVDTYEKVLSVFRKYDIRYFFYIGGNDSMDAVAKLSAYFADCAYEVRIIGVPKTIDNDLAETDHTPGFGSAAKYIATTVHEILRDCAVYTVPAVTLVEIMGRDAGWLTAAAALPGAIGPAAVDLLYAPERPFRPDVFLSDVRAALARHPNVVVALSEGLRTEDGRYVGAGVQSGAVDTFGHRYLAGTGKALEHFVKEQIGCKVRSVELNLPQRCASHLSSRTDIEESFAVGRRAVQAALDGESGRMVAIRRLQNDPYRVTLDTVPVSRVANAVRTLPDAYINAAGNGVTDACIAYLRPLICGEVAPAYRDGLPVHCVL